MPIVNRPPMSDGSDQGAIEPNSRFDQSITLTDSDSSGAEERLNINIGFRGGMDDVTGYSPRPDGSPTGNAFVPFNSSGDFGKYSGVNGPPSPDLSPPTSAFPGFRSTEAGFSGFSAMDDPVPSSPELAQIFSLISKFQPPPLDLMPHFKPFVPDLIPSIGAIDAFIKVPRPDGEQDPLGLTTLDEPTIGCSSPQLMKMQLRERFGVVGGNEGDGYIGFIEQPRKNYKALQAFLESYDEVSTNRAAPTMTYSYKMPDLEELMQVWPDEMERALESLPLPTADMDLSLTEYAQVICALLDIPVKGNVVESLHVLFSLYQEFKSNLFFQTKGPGAGAPGGDGVESIDIL